jgi:hypothetical protein
MDDLCEHETFRSICGICHRDNIVTRLTAERDALASDELDEILDEKNALITRLTAEVEDLGNRLHQVHRLWANNEHALREEVERLRAALRAVMIGGNHLVSIIGATHPQTGSHYEAALQFYGPGHKYDAWCCWNAIMEARAALEEK